MSRYCLIGDPHVTHKSLDLANKLFDLVEDIGLPTIWLGDFLDTKEVVRAKCLNLIFERLQKSKLHHIIIIGNHDWFNHECQDHSLQVLKSLSNVTIIDQFTVISDELVCLPYIHNADAVRDIIHIGCKDKIVIGHFDVSGFDYGNGMICEKGSSEDDFKDCQIVISGHFHKFQKSDNLIYLGTPFSHSFGESNQDKYIGILNTNPCSVEFLESPFRKHITTEVDCDHPTSIEIDDVHINRLVLTGSQENIDNYVATLNINPNVKIIKKPTNEFSQTISIDETLDNQTKFKTWASSIKQLDAETIELGLQILEAVK